MRSLVAIRLAAEDRRLAAVDGRGVLLDYLWPRLEKIVTIGIRMSAMALHKDQVAMVGHHPFHTSTGRNRGSIHSMEMAYPVLTQTYSGQPHVALHPYDAVTKRIDHDGVRPKLSSAQRPGGVRVYNGWDPFMSEGWIGLNEVESGAVEYLGLAGGYGHRRCGPMNWQPLPMDRRCRLTPNGCEHARLERSKVSGRPRAGLSRMVGGLIYRRDA